MNSNFLDLLTTTVIQVQAWTGWSTTVVSWQLCRLQLGAFQLEQIDYRYIQLHTLKIHSKGQLR